VSQLLDLDSEECVEFINDRWLFELAAELRRLHFLQRVEVLPRLEDLLRLAVPLERVDGLSDLFREFFRLQAASERAVDVFKVLLEFFRVSSSPD